MVVEFALVFGGVGFGEVVVLLIIIIQFQITCKTSLFKNNCAGGLFACVNAGGLTWKRTWTGAAAFVLDCKINL